MNSPYKQYFSSILIALFFLVLTLIVHFTGLLIYIAKKDWAEIETWKLAIVPTAIALLFLVILLFSESTKIASKRLTALVLILFLFVLYFMEGGIILSNYSCSWLGVYAIYLMKKLGDNTILHYALMTFVILINSIYIYFVGKLSVYLTKKLK